MIIRSVKERGQAHEYDHESAEHEEDEGVEGEPLLSSDASAEESAVMVQVLHAHLAVVAMTHLELAPVAGLAVPQFFLLRGRRHVTLTYDPWVHRDGQEVGEVQQHQHQQVQLGHGPLEFGLV